jgi:hypothetical protein
MTLKGRMMTTVKKTATLDPQHGQSRRYHIYTHTYTHTHLLLSENGKDAGGGMRAPWSCPVSDKDGVKARQRKFKGTKVLFNVVCFKVHLINRYKYEMQHWQYHREHKPRIQKYFHSCID